MSFECQCCGEPIANHGCIYVDRYKRGSHNPRSESKLFDQTTSVGEAKYPEGRTTLTSQSTFLFPRWSQPPLLGAPHLTTISLYSRRIGFDRPGPFSTANQELAKVVVEDTRSGEDTNMRSQLILILAVWVFMVPFWKNQINLSR